MKKAIIFNLFFLMLLGCKKAQYLDVKPDQSIAEPKTLEQIRSILDNDIIMNGGTGQGGGVDPQFLLSGTDDHYFLSDYLTFLDPAFTNLYTWKDDIYGLQFQDWNRVYQAIFYANTALDALSKIGIGKHDEDLYDEIKGSALFFRARFYYQLAQVFAPHYNKATEEVDWGLVLRLKSDINEPIRRSTIKESYDLIIRDLKQSANLLKDFATSNIKTRPTKAAAYAMLGKTYLVMGDYENARLYSDSCLQIQNNIVDYNTLSETASFPFSPILNEEIIFHSKLNYTLSTITDAFFLGRIDSNLYKSYDENDLRKSLFFRPATPQNSPSEVTFKGSYDGSNSYFTGLATDEVLLTRAEANARTNRVQEAIDDLNTLMIRRWRNNGSFIPFSTSSQGEALSLILKERRKELLQRGTRWTDLRRLNQEGANITITRIVNGETFTLPPNDMRYTFLIPPDVIAFNPDMPQNSR